MKGFIIRSKIFKGFYQAYWNFQMDGKESWK